MGQGTKHTGYVQLGYDHKQILSAEIKEFARPKVQTSVTVDKDRMVLWMWMATSLMEKLKSKRLYITSKLNATFRR